MRTIIAGSRTIESYEFCEKIIDSCPWKNEITEVVSGTCRGPDLFGEKWAQKHNIPIKRFPPDWSVGKKGGVLRNQQMADYADAAIIISRDNSAGTSDMKARAEKKGLKIHYVEVKDKDVFSLAQLKELRQSLEGKQFVGGELSRKLLDQQIKQLMEYQQVIRDCNTMMEALLSCVETNYADSWYDCIAIDEKLLEKALSTPTANFITSLKADRANNKQNS